MPTQRQPGIFIGGRELVEDRPVALVSGKGLGREVFEGVMLFAALLPESLQIIIMLHG